jgi:hypothetical protein
VDFVGGHSKELQKKIGFWNEKSVEPLNVFTSLNLEIFNSENVK